MMRSSMPPFGIGSDVTLPGARHAYETEALRAMVLKSVGESVNVRGASSPEKHSIDALRRHRHGYDVVSDGD